MAPEAGTEQWGLQLHVHSSQALSLLWKTPPVPFPAAVRLVVVQKSVELPGGCFASSFPAPDMFLCYARPFRVPPGGLVCVDRFSQRHRLACSSLVQVAAAVGNTVCPVLC